MPKHVRRATDELQALFESNALKFRDLILAMVRKTARGEHIDRQRAQLGDLIAESMTVSDLMGRRRLLLEADAFREDVPDELASQVLFRDVAQMVPSVPFKEAIRDIVRREPRLAESAEAVAEIYKRRQGFALARSAEIAVTKRVQKAVEVLSKGGSGTVSATKILQKIGVEHGADKRGWTEAYSETVYRTNLNTAYTAGRFQQAKDENVAKVIGGFQLDAINDGDVRRGRVPQDSFGEGVEHHLAGDGLIAATTDPIWEFASPPHGYNCRCSLIMVSRFRLKRMGLIEPNGKVRRFHPKGMAYFQTNFRPHPNFERGRPDGGIYG